MRVACAISVRRGYLSHKAQTDIDTFLAAIPVPPFPKDVPAANYIKRIQTDKKVRNKKARFVLLKKVGETVLDRDVSDQEIMDSILEIRGKTQ